MLANRFSEPGGGLRVRRLLRLPVRSAAVALAPPASAPPGRATSGSISPLPGATSEASRSTTPARTRSWRTPTSWSYGRPSTVATIPAYNWFDLAASYTFRNGIKLTPGQQHPRRGTAVPSGDGYAGINLYDPARAVRLLERAVQLLAPSTVAVFVAPTLSWAMAR